MASALDITAATVEPALLDLPWQLPLEDWPAESIAALPKGLSRHIVRFAHLGDYVIAIKETLPELARREYDMLKNLNRLAVPCVEPFAVVSNRTDENGEPLISGSSHGLASITLPHNPLIGPNDPEYLYRPSHH